MDTSRRVDPFNLRGFSENHDVKGITDVPLVKPKTPVFAPFPEIQAFPTPPMSKSQTNNLFKETFKIKHD